jgi:hypothetical protein
MRPAEAYVAQNWVDLVVRGLLSQHLQTCAVEARAAGDEPRALEFDAVSMEIARRDNARGRFRDTPRR